MSLEEDRSGTSAASTISFRRARAWEAAITSIRSLGWITKVSIAFSSGLERHPVSSRTLARV